MAASTDERAAQIEAWRQAQIDKAPPPTESQIRTLAAVLNGGSQRVAS